MGFIEEILEICHTLFEFLGIYKYQEIKQNVNPGYLWTEYSYVA